MPDEQQQGLFKKSTLTFDEVEAIKQLAILCETHEQLHMRLEWSMLQYRSGTATNDFLYYEDGLLVGYLAMDDHPASENELVGMVHPEYRRRGIFSQLLTAAQEEARARGVQQFILVCERMAYTGHAFLRAKDARLSESEHEMILAKLPQQRVSEHRLKVHQADRSEIDILVAVQSDSFNDPIEATRSRVEQCLQHPDRIYYLAVTEAGEAVGCFRLDKGEDFVGIYAFGVRSAYQGHGYGRQMLEEAISIIRAQTQKSIMLDVDVENTRAFRLYQGCGFKIRTTYDYYVLEL
ncbi:GNAT family N-acetyltransferase [Dictyobacter arantiisoli]|uniref:GNAT family N-acetyltransferase n=1 Tax=Dictyobacter arantiisoli TaxID=2014874 RepID=A0A5A5TF23_9CHLR|nr:GNAT family N-acetyltransferase [Dictyobacter arantiisoli]GCF10170.1 GNAT family N-acetyltransferase [Dictyobacter arantiisoli]